MRYDFKFPRSVIEGLIDEWIFSERDRKLLKRRLLDGITYENLAEEFDLSVRQVKAIVYKCEDKLYKKIGL
jgi:DNA-directed RNA polymerase specialized sigma24 family protein